MQDNPGLLLVNLGSPDAPTSRATRKYLAEFLHDYRVVDTSRWIWCPILHGIILRLRPARSARLYQKVWSAFGGVEGDEAPLIRITRAQVTGVQARLGDAVHVETAMRYGNPSIENGLKALKAKGCTRIAVLPLYPQFAGATTASVYDGVAMALENEMDVPELRFMRHYFDDPRYITALGDSLTEHIEGLGWKPDAILTSYHGLPQSYVEKGDPYQRECLTTTEMLRAEMKMPKERLYATFQSRFGPKEWLQPYTDKTLEALPAKGVRNVVITMPGFAADCLETLEEIEMDARETFMAAGGENFSVVPCLNDRPDHIELLTNLARERLLRGWL